MFGLIKNLAGMLNQSSLNTLTLSGSSYMDLPVELRSLRKGPINIKKKDKNKFLWCRVRHVNPLKEHTERIKKK